MIVHDTDDDAGNRKVSTDATARSGTTPESQHDTPGPSTRRKAKETQYRLGVGRPTAIGGTGPRAITTSGNKQKGKRVKASASVPPAEGAIPEEEEGKTVPIGLQFGMLSDL